MKPWDRSTFILLYHQIPVTSIVPGMWLAFSKYLNYGLALELVMAELAGWGNSGEPSFEKPEIEAIPGG